MIVIADNDILKKLACFDLVDEFTRAFDVGLGDVYVLNTAKHVLKSERTRKRIDAESFNRLSAFLDAVNVISVAPDPDEQVALTEQQNIDTGEAVLFSVSPRMPGAILTTGDKRSLESLANVDDATCKSLCKKLAGTVVCFEQIIERIIDCIGFDSVRDKLVLGREYDKALAIIIGSGLDATEAVVREGLASYVNDLRKKTGSLLQSPDRQVASTA